jgi:hypothetical protein
VKPRFLLDENVEWTILRRLRRHYPTMHVLAVGEPNAPPLHSKDPDLLDWIETHQYILVTWDRRSMPQHLADHYDKGGQLPGVFLLRRDASFSAIVEALYLVWEASEAEEYKNSILYLP